MKILFVCRGNVARSQMAEAYFNELKNNSKWTAVSAGTKLSGPEETLKNLSKVIKHVLDVMKEDGIDISTHVRRNLSKEMVDNANIVVLTVDEHDPIPSYLKNNIKNINWEVVDPKGKNLEFTINTRNQIKRLVVKLINNLDI